MISQSAKRKPSLPPSGGATRAVPCDVMLNLAVDYMHFPYLITIPQTFLPTTRANGRSEKSTTRPPLPLPLRVGRLSTHYHSWDMILHFMAGFSQVLNLSLIRYPFFYPCILVHCCTVLAFLYRAGAVQA